MKHTAFSPRALALSAMLGALSAVLMVLELPLPFAPSYMKFDISDLPALFAGFFLGPASGSLVIGIKILLKLLLKGTETAFVGEFMNLLCSLAFLLPAALCYRYWHTKKGALLSVGLGTLLASIFAIFGNLYVALPMYVKLYGIPMETILIMASAVNPLVYDMESFLIFCILPFNLVKYSITSLLTYLLYKRTANVLRRISNSRSNTAAAK